MVLSGKSFADMLGGYFFMLKTGLFEAFLRLRSVD